MDLTKREQIALFRYQVIAPLLSVTPGDGRLTKAIMALADREWMIPFSEKRFLKFKTIECWYYAYKARGLQALEPEGRDDAGISRTISEPVGDLIEAMIRAPYKLTGPVILKELEASGIIQPGQISLSSFYRFRRARGLDRLPQGRSRDRRAFSFANPNECWQSDMLFGPHIAMPDGGRRRVYLYAVMDDCTRLICHAQFYFEQHLSAFQDAIKQALMKRGVPKRLYVDNAQVFRSRPLLLAAGQLGIHLIHSKIGQPQGRGKIERWFRTVRSSFLSRLDTKTLTDIDHLNQLLWAWIEGEYHQKTHQGIGEAPIDKWIRLSDAIQVLPPGVDLDRIFFCRETRRVKADGTFQLKGKLFEAGVQFIRQKIHVAYDPFDLRSVWIWTDELPDEIQAFPLDALANSTIARAPDPPTEKPKDITLMSLEHLLRQMNRNEDDEQGDDHVQTPVPH